MATIEDKNLQTVKPNKGVRFYNPGDHFSEPMNYSMTTGMSDIHAIARWTVDAPQKSFFQVPTELRFSDNTRQSIDFPSTVVTRFKSRGVIMIDEEWEPGEDDDENDRMPFARTDSDAVVKGDRLWIEYLQTVVTQHIDQCNRAKAQGGMPLAASGFARRAFKLLNMVDPAQHAFEQLQKKPDEITSDRERSLQAQIDGLTNLVHSMASKKEAEKDVSLDEKIEETAKKAAKPKATK